MNLNALHHYLTKLSKSELLYQSGHIFEGWKNLNKIRIQGREVYLLKEEPLYSSVHAVTDNLGTAHQNLSIKRNSRFNPVPEHVHSHIELNYVYSGNCPQVINGKKVLLKKNQVLLIDTGCPHSIDALGKDDIMLSILIRKGFLRDHLYSQFSEDSILSRFFINAITEKTNHEHFLLFHSENDRRIPLFFRELFCECFDPSINSNDILLHLFYVIMAELINVYENDLAKEENYSLTVPIVPMIRYIQNNFKTCTQESVADFFHISPNYVTILLKKHTGMTYIQMIQAQKLDYAASLLAGTSLPVTEISNEAGYENISFFYKKFKNKYQLSPKEYREKNSEAAANEINNTI